MAQIQNEYSFLPFGAGGIAGADNSGTGLPAPRWYSGTGVPTAGTYNLGDVMYNCNQSAGQPFAWVCYVAGTSGSWQVVGLGVATPSTVTATSGTLTSGQDLILLNPASASTYSLPEASSVVAGKGLSIKNVSANTVTLTPLGTDAYQDAAAITLTQNQGILLFSNATTVWYNRAIAQLPALTTTATSGTLTNGQRLILLNPASTGTYSLPEASANYPGFATTIKNLASGSTTLTPLGTDSYADAAAITLAQFAVVTLITDATTHWYKQS